MTETIDDVKAGDFIRFHRVIRAAQDVKHRTDFDTGKAQVVQPTAQRVEDLGGAGLVLKLQGDVKIDGETYRTAKVDAGPWIKSVRAVLNDAELQGVQTSLGLAHSHGVAAAAGMYSTDSKRGS